MSAVPQSEAFPNQIVAQPSGALVSVEQSRAIAETQAAMVIAKKYPRDQMQALDRIQQAFTRPLLAEVALYSYARGGTDITGPSIRAAETLAQCWGNMEFGVRELSQANGESQVEAFAWDKETNTRQVKVFTVPHSRYSRDKGNTRLTDPRDIYEMVANQGARRLRACILGIIPGDIVEAAMNQAEVTLRTKAEVTPERLKNLVEKFAEFNVTQEQIEKYIQRRLDAMTPALLVRMGKVYNSIHEGMSKAADWFDPVEGAEAPAPQAGAAGIKDKVRARAAAETPKAAEAAPGPAGEAPAPITDEAVALKRIESAANGEAAAEVLDLCIGQPFYARAVAAFNARWAQTL